MTAHHCHAVGCMVLVSPRLLMCLKHWNMVPRLQQARVWASYRRGQEVTKDPSPEYLEAMRAAIATVASREAAVRDTGGSFKAIKELTPEGPIGQLWNQLNAKGGV